ncbi:MAG TPA: STAS domain-containing protein [Lacunisphaera sp.]|jgi:anti-anti-sigma regulatory factor|nr:STAS domain-containing protein [Lacunisphaera sp.]
MKIEGTADTIRITELRKLDDVERAEEIVSGLRGALRDGIRYIEVDLSRVNAINSLGVAMLLAAREAGPQSGAMPVWRIVNPAPAVRQLLELVRAHRVFEIAPPREPEEASS